MSSGNEQKTSGAADRRDRLAAELRANLKRRKGKTGGSDPQRKTGGKTPKKTER